MSKCKSLYFSDDRICISDLKHHIGLYTRDIVAPNFLGGTNVDYTEKFTLISNVWSAIKVINGTNEFNSVSINKTNITHFFYIRYKAGITQETWVDYRTNRYNIMKVENLNENNKYLKLYCILSGDKDKAGSQI